MKNPLVSIITPSFNCANTVERTIESVLKQSYQNWEMLIVDDCSTDNSCEVIEEIISHDKRISLTKSCRNAGSAVTRNRAIECARGRFIAFLDADDIWHPLKLEKQINFMLKKNIHFSFTSYRRVNKDHKVIGYRTTPVSLTYHDLLKTNKIGCLTVCYDSKNIGKIHMPNITQCQDFGLWLKILKRVKKGYGIKECLADYYVGASTTSSNKIANAKYVWRVFREIEKLSFIQSSYYFLFYTYHGIKNRCTQWCVSIRQ